MLLRKRRNAVVCVRRTNRFEREVYVMLVLRRAQMTQTHPNQDFGALIVESAIPESMVACAPAALEIRYSSRCEMKEVGLLFEWEH